MDAQIVARSSCIKNYIRSGSQHLLRQLFIFASMRISCFLAVPLLLFATGEASTPCDTTLTVVTVTTFVTATLSTKPTSSSLSTTSSMPHMTIAITNAYETQLSLAFGVNEGFPTPVGNPQPTVLSKDANTQYLFPYGWAGRIVVGPTTAVEGSKIEGSYITMPDIDVSYVDGYTVPITCSVQGVVVTGCNVELFDQPGIKCNDLMDGPLCLNPARSTPNGPPTCFFGVCAGAAYTYPNDNRANIDSLQSRLISCCIGTSCAAPSRQHDKKTYHCTGNYSWVSTPRYH